MIVPESLVRELVGLGKVMSEGRVTRKLDLATLNVKLTAVAAEAANWYDDVWAEALRKGEIEGDLAFTFEPAPERELDPNDNVVDLDDV